MVIIEYSGFILTFADVMPYNRNNRNDRPFKKDLSGKEVTRRKRKDSDENAPNPGYDPNDKDELAPPRFLERSPRPDTGKKPYGDTNKRPYSKREPGGFGDRPKKPYDQKTGDRFNDRPKRPYEKKTGDSYNDRPKKPYVNKDRDGFNERPKKPFIKKDKAELNDRPKRSYVKRDTDSFSDKPVRHYEKRDTDSFSNRPKKQFEKRDDTVKKPFRPKYDPEIVNKKQHDLPKKTFSERKRALTGETTSKDDIRLNKYVANSGICSRREADELIAKGMVAVNGKVITEMGHKVKPGDTVTFNGKKILPEPYVYIIMNKPKDFLTTTEDDKGRKTVMDLVADKIEQRIFPVGRLDRNTTGVLLLTNDGEVTQALTHPSFEIKKVYQVELDKKATGADLDKLVSGIELEDGEAHADAVAFVESEDKKHVGIEIHSGRNRIVRRMFEHLGYEVVKLDRVSFGIFTKKDLPRGKWRHMTQSEVGFLMKLKSQM